MAGIIKHADVEHVVKKRDEGVRTFMLPSNSNSNSTIYTTEVSPKSFTFNIIHLRSPQCKW